MLFNSHIFIFLFLPITLLGFFTLGSRGYYRIALAWLILASLFFYGWWNPIYLSLLILSILCNYTLGQGLNRYRNKTILILGISANLALLGYYKYANFFIANVNSLFGSSYYIDTILLPLAISFFTFQQIAYLVDSYRGETKHYQFLHYTLFVTFFPQLIAGPIVYHREMLPQFSNTSLSRYSSENFSVGLTIFGIGLFKKVVLADNIALYATPVFEAAEQGAALSFLEAWGGVLGYTLQLYFDFSGYSDMAVGLARMFGIILPLNFYSPYKAINIIEFWHRWHITLSRFLRDYLYIPLGGNRKGTSRRFFNLMLTLFLGGLWHGAGWTFVLWGLLHGIYLVINHLWQQLWKRLNPNSPNCKGEINDKTQGSLIGQSLSILITFIAVTVAWVLFRAANLNSAFLIYKSMIGLQGIVFTFDELPLFSQMQLTWLIVLLIIVWVMPNTYQLMQQFRQVLPTNQNRVIQPFRLQWQPTRRWAVISALITGIAILSLTRITEFLYFQF